MPASNITFFQKIKNLVLDSRRNQIFLILIITLATYINIFQNGFAWDDRDFLIDWPSIKSTGEYPAYLSLPYLLAGDLPANHRGIYRPIRSVAYLTSYSIWGQNPFGYHLQAMIIHLLIVALVYLIVDLMTKNRAVAFITSTLFAVNPIHTESVTYITASFDTLGILFFFLAFYFYLKAKQEKYKKNILQLASIIYAYLAFFTYEMTLVLPLVIVLYEFCSTKFNTKKLIPTLNLSRFYFLGVIIYFAVRFIVLGIGDRAAYLGFSWEVAANQARVVTPVIFKDYITWLIWPVNLTISHNIPINMLDWFIKTLNTITPSGTLVNLSSYISFLFPIFYYLIAILLLYKILKRYPLALFGLVWFILALLPVSNIIPQGAAIAERYLYIPSFGLIFFLSLSFWYLLTKFKDLRIKSALILFLVAIIGFYSCLTIIRNSEWRDEKSIWYAAIRANPNYPLPYAALATRYTREHQFEPAIGLFQKAIELDSTNARLISDLGLVYEKVGNIEKSINQHQKALEVEPNYYPAHAMLGNIYMQQKKYDLAEQEYKDALNIRPNDHLIISYLGNVYLNQEQFDKALEQYLLALSYDPVSYDLSYQVGLTYLKQKKYDLAIKVFKTAIALNPQQSAAYFALNKTYLEKGDSKQASEILKEGLKITNNPEFAEELKQIQ